MSSDGRQPHILIVDDSPEILELLRELLEDEGYRVTTALAHSRPDDVKALAPDLIIQDLLVAQAQEPGLTFLTVARLDPELAHIPLILCTAAADIVRDEAMAETLRRLGVRVVLKPFAVEAFLHVVSEAVSESQSAPTPRLVKPPQE